MWRVFDELIDAVPAGARVEDLLVGRYWTAVRSSLGVGLAMTQREAGAARAYSGDPVGGAVRDLARWIKSWNFVEAAIGLAAINSALNAPSAHPAAAPVGDSFARVAAAFAGRKVATIGHFRGTERLAEACEFTVIERRPGPGDLPDSACEYVLSGQDLVIVTATTLINKTLPRLLQLARGAEVMVCGPSAPLSPVLFGHGVGTVGGVVVEDPARVWRTTQAGLERGVHRWGVRTVEIFAPGAAA